MAYNGGFSQVTVLNFFIKDETCFTAEARTLMIRFFKYVDYGIHRMFFIAQLNFSFFNFRRFSSYIGS